jgi:hypothetical protein
MYDFEFLPPDQITYEGLDSLSKPLLAGQPEQFPTWLYDTQLFTAATSTDLFFFQAVNPDKTLCNIPNQAMLPSGEYFWPQYAMFDPLFNGEVAAATIAGMYDEINRLVHTSHPDWTLTIKSKTYGPWPLSICHSTGGAVGGGMAGIAGPLWLNTGQNSIPDGGARVKGVPIIPPTTTFVVQVHWNGLVAGLVAATVLCRFTLAGPYFRAVA